MTGPRVRFVRPGEPGHPLRAAHAAMPASAAPPAPRGLVVHAAWLPGPTGAQPQLLIWAEIDTTAVDDRIARRATAPPHPYLSLHPHPQPHPACVRGSALASVLERLWKTSRPGVRPRSKSTQSSLAVWLPSWNGRPLPSSELVRAGWTPDPALQGVDASRVSLRLWQVHALALDAESAGTLLAGLPHLEGAEAGEGGAPAATSHDGHATMPRLLLGSDLRLWSAAAKFALDLLVRQRYVPSCETLPAEQVYSSWSEMEVVLGRWCASLADPADRARFDALAAAMPDLCRAAANSARTSDPEHAPDARGLLQAFVDVVVHARVSYWLRQDGLLPTLSRSAYDFYDRYSFGPSYYGFGPSGSLTERWLWSLLRPEEPMYLSPPEAARLVGGVRRWHAGLQGVGGAAFRLCLRLCPPDVAQEGEPDAGAAQTHEDGAAWRLEYLLQARDDPSLLVSLEQVWRGRGSIAAFLDRRFVRPREQALTALIQAGRLFRPIAASLSEAHPLGCDLTGSEAYSFLVEALPLLEEAGFGVLAPAWWKRATPRPSLRLQLRKPQKTSTGLMGLEAVLSYDWKLALGGQELEREELERLVELKQPLVRVRGQWMELRQEQVEAALAFVRAHPGGRMSLGEALRVSLTGEAAGGEVDVEDVHTDEWIGELFSRLRGGQMVEEVPQPEALRGVLRPYQLRGLSWLAFLTRHGLGACLADDMGLGKTVQLLALALHQKALGQLTRPVLLVCPTSVVGNWVHEVARFAPDLRVLVHHGAERIGRSAAASLAAEAAAHDLVITTYSLLPRDEAALRTVEWGGVVLDEAQNIKNAEAKQSRAARNLKAPMRVVLTGTPVENRLSELWSIMDFLNPAYLGSHRRFHENFALPIEKLRDRQATTRLQALVRPFILRRLKTDPSVISDLPEKLEMREYCTLTREQVTLYEAVVREGLAQIEQSAGDMERRGIVLAMLTRLKQVCNHPAHFLGDSSDLAGRSGKLARLEELIEELLAEGDRALLFTQFTAMGELLQPYLQERFGTEVLYLHGGVPRQQRERLIARFQSADGPSLFLLSLKAGGTGLNLTRANHVIHFDRWWNPAVENQATDRAFRIGQTRNVQVRKFVCTGTLEERIDTMIEQKRELAETVIGTGEGWITEMSTEQLRELLSLRADVLAD